MVILMISTATSTTASTNIILSVQRISKSINDDQKPMLQANGNWEDEGGCLEDDAVETWIDYSELISFNQDVA